MTTKHFSQILELNMYYCNLLFLMCSYRNIYLRKRRLGSTMKIKLSLLFVATVFALNKNIEASSGSSPKEVRRASTSTMVKHIEAKNVVELKKHIAGLKKRSNKKEGEEHLISEVINHPNGMVTRTAIAGAFIYIFGHEDIFQEIDTTSLEIIEILKTNGLELKNKVMHTKGNTPLSYAKLFDIQGRETSFKTNANPRQLSFIKQQEHWHAVAIQQKIHQKKHGLRDNERWEKLLTLLRP